MTINFDNQNDNESITIMISDIIISFERDSFNSQNDSESATMTINSGSQSNSELLTMTTNFDDPNEDEFVILTFTVKACYNIFVSFFFFFSGDDNYQSASATINAFYYNQIIKVSLLQ